MKVQITVTLELPKGGSRRGAADYVAYAICSMPALENVDPFINLDLDSVKVRLTRKPKEKTK